MISYSDILACFYLVAPYIISRAENVNDIDTLINLMVAYCQMKAPFAQKIDMADEFHKTEVKNFKPPSRVKQIGKALLWTLVSGGCCGCGGRPSSSCGPSLSAPAGFKKVPDEQKLAEELGLGANFTKKELKSAFRKWSKLNQITMGLIT